MIYISPLWWTIFCLSSLSFHPCSCEIWHATGHIRPHLIFIEGACASMLSLSLLRRRYTVIHSSTSQWLLCPWSPRNRKCVGDIKVSQLFSTTQQFVTLCELVLKNALLERLLVRSGECSWSQSWLLSHTEQWKVESRKSVHVRPQDSTQWNH